MKTVNLFLVAIFLITLDVPTRAQQKDTREKMPSREPVADNSPGNSSKRSVNTTRGSNGSGRAKPPKPKPTSALSIRVTPSDSKIYLQGEEYRAENGLCNIAGLPAGKYNLIVRRDGYRDDGGEITLSPGVETPLQFSLVPFNGTLHVAPLVADTEIHVVESATSKSVGVYFGQVRYIEFPPGRYQILISKEGYQTLVREVVIEPAAKISLEPSLAPLPKPVVTPRRAAPPFRRDSATRAQSNLEGKFIVVVLYGRSGDTLSALGAIDVTLRVGGGQAHVASISGMFTGYPCQVDFVRLENVAEYSFVEPPGAANQWARAVVRIRPKESKRPVHFLINWKSLRDAAPDGPSIN